MYAFYKCFILIILIGYLLCAKIPVPKIDHGSSSLVHGRTVFGAVIMSDSKSTIARMHLHPHSINDIDETVRRILSFRLSNTDTLVKGFDFELYRWPMVNTQACPHYLHSKHSRSERGFGMSHLQVWMEFAFFDHDVLDAMGRPTPEYITSNSYSSVSGVFTALQDGSLIKNDSPFLDEDILLVFEDNAVWHRQFNNSESATADSDERTKTLSAVLSNISVDVLSLSNSNVLNTIFSNSNEHPAAASAVELSAGLRAAGSAFTPSAYALTRRGARKLIAFYDHCGGTLEEQVAYFAEHGLLTIATASPALFEAAADPPLS